VTLADEIRPLLTTVRLGRAVRAYHALGSTMNAAATWAAEAAPDGALVLAEHQTAGRGRHGRTWADTPGAGLLLSLILRPTLAAESLGMVPLAAGVAVAEAVEEVAGLAPALKWPNDVLVDGRKAAGVLVEGQFAAGQAPVLVVGVGVNVNGGEPPPEAAPHATSLAVAAGRPVARAPLLAAFLGRLEEHLDGLAEDGGARLRAAWEARMAGRDATVTVRFPGTERLPLHGRALGLAGDGALRLATTEGEVPVYAGECTIGSDTPRS